MHIDKLLQDLVDLYPQETKAAISSKEWSVLSDLKRSISNGVFVTENQANFVIAILSRKSQNFPENLKQLILENLKNPTWSKEFRYIERIKEFYINKDQKLVVEYSYLSALRENFQKIMSSFDGEVQQEYSAFANKLTFALTEQNISLITRTISKWEFNIDKKLENFIKIIESWDELSVKKTLSIENFKKTDIKQKILHEVKDDELLLADRRLKYQYFYEIPDKIPENLVEHIAYRNKTKVWVNPAENSLDELLDAINRLERFPLLIVMSLDKTEVLLENLRKIHEKLENLGINQGIGVYFRLKNEGKSSKFNKYIADHNLNAFLDENLKVAILQNNKIPKFFLKNPWQPASVISIGKPIRITKISHYANFSDCIIDYTEGSHPLFDLRTHAWQ